MLTLRAKLEELKGKRLHILQANNGFRIIKLRESDNECNIYHIIIEIGRDCFVCKEYRLQLPRDAKKRPFKIKNTLTLAIRALQEIEE